MGIVEKLAGDPFSAVANAVTVVGTVYTVISEIVAHAKGDGTFNFDVLDPQQQTIDEIAKIKNQRIG